MFGNGDRPTGKSEDLVIGGPAKGYGPPFRWSASGTEGESGGQSRLLGEGVLILGLSWVVVMKWIYKPTYIVHTTAPAHTLFSSTL
jgi:hypothetical protein